MAQLSKYKRSIKTLKFSSYHITTFFRASDHKSDCGNHQPSRRFLEEGFAMQIIMDYRTTPAVNFTTKLRFNQHHPIMTQEQSIC